MKKRILFVFGLITAYAVDVSCFSPAGMSPDVTSSTSGADGAAPTTSPTPPTTAGHATSTSTTSTATTSVPDAGAPTSTTSAGPDLPACDRPPGLAWGPCLGNGTCGPGAGCVLTTTGATCSPTCVRDADCVDPLGCALSPGLACEAGLCVATCGPDVGCAAGSWCDDASGTCAWPGECHLTPQAGAWEPCGPGNACPGDAYCIADGDTSICAPSCPCVADVVTCGVHLGDVECGDADLCVIPCSSDLECAGGMVCGRAGACAWPAVG